MGGVRCQCRVKPQSPNNEGYYYYCGEPSIMVPGRGMLGEVSRICGRGGNSATAIGSPTTVKSQLAPSNLTPPKETLIAK